MGENSKNEKKKKKKGEARRWVWSGSFSELSCLEGSRGADGNVVGCTAQCMQVLSALQEGERQS